MAQQKDTQNPTHQDGRNTTIDVFCVCMFLLLKVFVSIFRTMFFFQDA